MMGHDGTHGINQLRKHCTIVKQISNHEMTSRFFHLFNFIKLNSIMIQRTLDSPVRHPDGLKKEQG